jgi:hypothetical protein
MYLTLQNYIYLYYAQNMEKCLVELVFHLFLVLIQVNLIFRDIKPIMLKGLSWSWSYGSWIYNYLCNQCIWPLMLWVRIPRIADFLKFVFILLDIGPTPRNFLLDPLNFCRTYIFYVKLFYSQATSYRYYYFSLAEHFLYLTSLVLVEA